MKKSRFHVKMASVCSNSRNLLDKSSFSVQRAMFQSNLRNLCEESVFRSRLRLPVNNFNKYKKPSHKETLSNGVVESLANALKNILPVFWVFGQTKNRLETTMFEHLGRSRGHRDLLLEKGSTTVGSRAR